jgi:tetraacyldisaccharide 4'-kinase
MLKYIYNLATDKSSGIIPGLLKLILFAFSLIYGLVVRLLMGFCRLRQYRAECKVISVGNITLGGTGKTPLVEYLARWANRCGHKAAIITRGYMTEDEPRMLRENLNGVPVVVDADRAKAINTAVSGYAVDTVILDDGFQQWRIKKDLEIVVLDAANPFGNRNLLPRGILRQPLSTLKLAQVFILTKTDAAAHPDRLREFLQKINPEAMIAESLHRPVGFYALGKRDVFYGADEFKGKTVALLCGIGDPAYFAHSLRSLGVDIGTAFNFTDHHVYRPQDLENIMKACQAKGIEAIITTEKDAVKLNPVLDSDCLVPVFVLRIELQFTQNEQGFLERLSQLYGL